MIAIEVDFNHSDGRGGLPLADLAAHAGTPFADLAGSDGRILFVDGDEYVEGRLVDDPERGWVGVVDWDTQDKIRSYPSDRSQLIHSVT